MFCGGFGNGYGPLSSIGYGTMFIAMGFRMLVFIGLIVLGFKLFKSYANKSNDPMRILNEKFALIVLDLMLPKITTGEEVCNKIRSSSNVPIIMLTAKADEDEKIEGISIGADDYLT